MTPSATSVNSQSSGHMSSSVLTMVMSELKMKVPLL